jgi:hypothetical protein
MLIIKFDEIREGGELSESSLQDDGSTQPFEGTSSSSTTPRTSKSRQKFIT